MTPFEALQAGVFPAPDESALRYLETVDGRYKRFFGHERQVTLLKDITWVSSKGESVTLAAGLHRVVSLCEHYERRGDHLVQFGDVVRYLTTMGLSRDVMVARFRLSVRNHEFGRHGHRQTIERLVDLDHPSAPAGMYSLRPSGLRAEACPELMRARRSVWAGWLQDQSWPVAPWLGRPIGSLDADMPDKKGKGRPSAKAVIETELRRRARATPGELKTKVGEEARALAKWVGRAHPEYVTKPKTIENNIRHIYRELTRK